MLPSLARRRSRLEDLILMFMVMVMVMVLVTDMVMEQLIRKAMVDCWVSHSLEFLPFGSPLTQWDKFRL